MLRDQWEYEKWLLFWKGQKKPQKPKKQKTTKVGFYNS